MPSSGFHNTRPAEPWDGVTERRSRVRPPPPPPPPVLDDNDHLTVGILREMLAEGRKETMHHVDVKLSELRHLIEDGFPNGDTRAHREVHERYIREAADRAALWKSIREKLVTSAVYAVALLVAGALWQHVVTLIHNTPAK